MGITNHYNFNERGNIFLYNIITGVLEYKLIIYQHF